MGGCAEVICKHYTVLCKGLEHPKILVSEGPGTNPSQIPRDRLYSVRVDTIYTLELLLLFFFTSLFRYDLYTVKLTHLQCSVR